RRCEAKRSPTTSTWPPSTRTSSCSSRRTRLRPRSSLSRSRDRPRAMAPAAGSGALSARSRSDRRDSLVARFERARAAAELPDVLLQPLAACVRGHRAAPQALLLEPCEARFGVRVKAVELAQRVDGELVHLALVADDGSRRADDGSSSQLSRQWAG